MIRISDVSKQFAGTRSGLKALDGLSLQIEKGAFFTLFGTSGCGKSTLLRCLAGLETPDTGEIGIAGRRVFAASEGLSVPTHRRRIGMVFQSYAIWPHMTVFANVAFPLEVQKAGDIRTKVMRALAMVGLAEFAERPATQLSGGQQQRVALARAIVADPEVLLLDEPLSNLDVALREQMRVELLDLQKAIGVTTVLVTHDQTEALSMSDRIAVMSAGRIVETGTPDEVYHRPRSTITGRLIGGANVLQGEAVATTGGCLVQTALGTLRSTAAANGKVQVMIRPENLVPGAPGAANLLRCRVRITRFAGQLREIELVPDACPDLRLRGRVEAGLALAPGDEIDIAIDPSAVHVILDTGTAPDRVD